MALTVGDLLKIPDLPITAVTGRTGASNAIRWVHVSELEDPTRWLKGGELLLTVGLGIGKTPAKQRAYIRRLVEAGLAGLGFGLGFGFQRVPKALVEEALKASFPVFEVPYETPFIAITEAVFTRLVAEQYDLLQRSLDAEHTLTRAVLDGEGVDGIVASLTRVTGGWAALLDLHGAPLSVVPRSVQEKAKRIWAELQASRPDGVRFSVSSVDRGQHFVIQPVSSQGRIEAFLALGKPEALTQLDRIVSSHALALLALELTKARAVSDVERRLKGDVLEQLLAGAIAPAEYRRMLERMGFDLARPMSVFAFSAEGPPEPIADALEEVLSRRTGAFLVSPRDDHALAVLQPEGAGSPGDIRAAVAERVGGSVRSGAGSPVPFDDLPRGAREARYALQVCLTERRLEAEFADLGTYQLLLSLQDPDALRTFASSVLSALDGYDEQHGGHLVPSLRAFLERNARWEAAASDLFVHRHTLRYRMRKVEELTRRDLATARDRMELFLALRARDLLDTSEWSAAPAGGR